MGPAAQLSLLALLASQAAADPASTLKSAIEDFEFGEHGKAAEKLAPLLNPIQLASAEDVIVARQYLGACYYLMDQRSRAEAEFAKILALDSEHKLDPQVFSPALVQFFEDVRSRTGLTLKKPPESPPKKAVELPTVVAPPAPAEPPLALAFVPFGGGQFNNRQPIRGTAFLVGEVGLFATALATFFMFQDVVAGHEKPDGTIEFTDRADADHAQALQTVYLTTFYVGLGVVALGIIEALVSYPGEESAAAVAPSSAASALSLSF